MKTTEITEELLNANYGTEGVLALACYLDVDADEITYQGHDIYSYGDEEYLICDDATADKYWDDELENYIEECIFPELDQRYQMYFDNEKWKRDARFDGRGHSLNHYDGTEEVETIDGTDYYIYRQN